jgi:hypothetical protein
MTFSVLDCHGRQGLGYPTPRMSSGWRFARASPFISLREIPQPLAQAKITARSLRALFRSAQEAAGVSRSEIKEEARAKRQPGDIREGSRPLPLGSGAKNRRSTEWEN